MHYTKRRQLNRTAVEQNDSSQEKPASFNTQNKQINHNTQPHPDKHIHITLSIIAQGKVGLKQRTNKPTPALLQNTKPIQVSQIPSWLKKKGQNKTKHKAKTQTPTTQRTESSVPRWLTLKPANTSQQDQPKKAQKASKKTPAAPVVFVPKTNCFKGSTNKCYDKKAKPTQATLLTAPKAHTKPTSAPASVKLVENQVKKGLKKPVESTKKNLLETIKGKISGCISLLKNKKNN